MNGFVARQDALAIDLDARHAARRRTGGDDDLLARPQRLRVALEDVDGLPPVSRAVPLIQSILFFLKRNSMPFRHSADDAILAGVHLRHVDADRSGTGAGDTPFLRLLDNLERVGVLEQRLGRDATPQQARPAERLLLLDHRDGEAELRGADGGNVTAGSGADHDDVVFLHTSEKGGRESFFGNCKKTPDPFYRFSEESGTKAVVPDWRAGSGATSWSGQ